jgi:hypothetical protein
MQAFPQWDAAIVRRSRPRVRNERQGRDVAHVAARGGPVSGCARSAFAHSLGTGGAEVRPRRTARRPCRTRPASSRLRRTSRPHASQSPEVVDRQPQGPSPRPLALRFLSVRISLRLLVLVSVARRRNRVAASPHRSRKRRAAPARRVPETVVPVGRNAAKSQMVGAWPPCENLFRP